MEKPTTSTETYKIFLSGLTKQTKKRALSSFFQELYPSIKQIKVKDYHKKLKKKKGFAILTLASKRDFLALLNTKTFYFEGQKLTADPHLEGERLKRHKSEVNRRKVYISDIPDEVDEEDIAGVLGGIGRLELVNIVRFKDKMNQIRHYGFATFLTENDALLVIRKEQVRVKGFVLGLGTVQDTYKESRGPRAASEREYREKPPELDGGDLEEFGGLSQPLGARWRDAAGFSSGVYHNNTKNSNKKGKSKKNNYTDFEPKNEIEGRERSQGSQNEAFLPNQSQLGAYFGAGYPEEYSREEGGLRQYRGRGRPRERGGDAPGFTQTHQTPEIGLNQPQQHYPENSNFQDFDREQGSSRRPGRPWASPGHANNHQPPREDKIHLRGEEVDDRILTGPDPRTSPPRHRLRYFDLKETQDGFNFKLLDVEFNHKRKNVGFHQSTEIDFYDQERYLRMYGAGMFKKRAAGGTAVSGMNRNLDF